MAKFSEMTDQEKLERLEELSRRANAIAQKIVGDSTTGDVKISIKIFRAGTEDANRRLVDASLRNGWKAANGETCAWTENGDGTITIFTNTDVLFPTEELTVA